MITLCTWTTPNSRKASIDELPGRGVGGQFRDQTSVHRWLKTVGERPAVQRGMKVPEV